MLESRLRDLFRAVRDEARAQGIAAEFTLHREQSSLIRLGNSAVALATFEELTRLEINVTEGRRTGSCSLLADISSADQLRDALRQARENCANSLEKDYDPIFGVMQADVDDSAGYDAALSELSPVTKTALCSEVIRALGPRGAYDFSGSWSSGVTEMYYASTANDHEGYRRLTDGRLVLVLKEQQRKWELSVEQSGKGVDVFSASAAIADFDRLLPIYEANAGYRTPLGHQRVIFGPQAIGELVSLAVWGGFLGRRWEEQRAYTAGKHPGDPLFPPAITLIDDPTNSHVYGMPFDFKGHLRAPYPLVEAGIFRGLLYDSATAARYHRVPTGHDTESTDFVLATGDAPAGLAAGMALAGDALYIPHLHYIHMPDPTRGQFTGSSRFNAQRLEAGACTAPLVSTRVTDTIPAVFAGVSAISRRAVLMDVSNTYGQRTPTATSVPEYMICDQVRISDVAEGF